MTKTFSFTVKNTDKKARYGIAQTKHGSFETPCFMVIGTKAAIKGIAAEEIREMNGEVVLCNTYHLHLRPGEQIIHKLGGLHRFMNWNGPILTDSGGYQVFSLEKHRKITDEGVLFRSHLDGKEHFLNPEKATEIQYLLGADMIMCFDECPPYKAKKIEIKKAVKRTSEWAKQCKKALEKIQKRKGTAIPALFGIAQGGIHEDLRKESVKQLIDIDFPGYAIGGVSVREPKPELHAITEFTAALLPENKIRYLMGVGQPEDILFAVENGIDLFDCVLPTRNARHGSLYTHSGVVRIKNKQYEASDEPLDSKCGCYTCQNFSKAYLRHLFFMQEPLGIRLNTIHNVYFYLTLMKNIRDAIKEKRFQKFKTNFLNSYITKDKNAPSLL